MAWIAVQESVTVAARAERGRAVRVFTREALGAGHPCADAAVLLVSELFTNSVLYGCSGCAGETVTVTLAISQSGVRVEVADCGGKGVPELRFPGRDAEHGRGLRLVDAMAARWGWHRYGGRLVTWFELRHG